MNLDRILLVEDDEATRHWLLSQLERQHTDVHACVNVSEAIAWLDQQAADIVLTDLGLPDGSGIDVIRHALRRHPRCEVLVISIFGDEGHVLSAIEAGASGYLLKDLSTDSLGEQLQHLKEGGSPLSPQIARTLVKRQRQMAPAPEAGHTAHTDGMALTSREQELLALIAKGFSYQESADLLSVSANTVRTYIKRIYQKLSVNSRAEAVYEFNQRQVQLGLSPLR
ncbi:MAG: response regulator transcription factor [Aquabacterium sp.]|uniref:response regulator transcription factor n=1 Tax=Aquabacterium sp. TaxID=1872578 RepID=UPI0025C3BAAD|nr:response regulator transcription factor [Aquabacterium sp.]MBI5925097.1 response regulator transcription factor [Aquabacterium sp.]